MAKLNRRRKRPGRASLICKGGDYEQFPDNLYVKSMNQRRLMWWIGCLDYITKEIDRTQSHHLILETERLLGALILLCLVKEDGSYFASYKDEEDCEIIHELLAECPELETKIYNRICAIHSKLNLKMVTKLREQLAVIDNIDFGIEFEDDDELEETDDDSGESEPQE